VTYPDPHQQHWQPEPVSQSPEPVSAQPLSPGYQQPYQQYPPVSEQPYSPQSGPYPPIPQQMVITTVRPTSGTAVASMVLGIIGVFGGWCMFGLPCIIAVILGHVALPATKSGQVGGRGMAVTGLILGYLFVVPMIIFTMMAFFGGVLGAVSPTPTPTP
jgi:hypothetical protein